MSINILFSSYRECLRFCFTELIQCELDKIATEWNQHSVRRTADNSGGKPDILYFLPERHGIVFIYYSFDVQVISRFLIGRRV